MPVKILQVKIMSVLSFLTINLRSPASENFKIYNCVSPLLTNCHPHCSQCCHEWLVAALHEQLSSLRCRWRFEKHDLLFHSVPGSYQARSTHLWIIIFSRCTGWFKKMFIYWLKKKTCMSAQYCHRLHSIRCTQFYYVILLVFFFMWFSRFLCKTLSLHFVAASLLSSFLLQRCQTCLSPPPLLPELSVRRGAAERTNSDLTLISADMCAVSVRPL